MGSGVDRAADPGLNEGSLKHKQALSEKHLAVQRVRPMRVCLVRLVGVPRTRVRPMGALRVRLPRRRRLGPGVPRRLLCRRWRRPAHSGLPHPRPPSNQPNQVSRASRPSQANRAGQGSRDGRPSRFSRASRVGQPNRASRFGRASLVCRGGVLLGRAPRAPTPGLRPPRVCRPVKGQERLLPQPVQGPRPAPAPQPGRLNRRLSAAPPVAPRGRPPVAVWGMLPVAVLVGAVLTPRRGPRLVWTAGCFSDSACFVLQAAFFRPRNSLSASSGVRYPRAE